jgi:glyoxylase-like metal-dependent hydrolase (beta-lactamase superfamily II)
VRQTLPLLAHLRCAAVLLVALAVPAIAQVDTKPAAMTLVATKVSERGWFFQGEAGMASTANRGFMSNAGFVVTPAGVVVFDALGTPALGDAMVAAIRVVTAQPIRRVIVSHYHADHVYGLQAFKQAGAEIWAHRKGEQYFTSGLAEERLAQRQRDLYPWVDERTRVVRPDLWLEGDTDFRLGGITFRILFAEGAHSPEDVMLYVVDDALLFAGDLLFAGRVPFVGTADSRGWLVALDKMLAVKPAVVVPGHGPLSRDVARDLVLTRDYLVFLRENMGRAVAELEPFDEAYAKADWSRFRGQPAFEQANRINAYGTYLLMEQEALSGGRK